MHYSTEDRRGISFIPPVEEQPHRSARVSRVPRRAVRVGLIVVYTAVAASALLCVHSVAGWLVLGLAPVLLWDRLTFRIVSPGGAESRIVQLGLRGSYLFLGAYGFSFFHDGHLSAYEAAFAGSVLALVTFLFEYFIEWAFCVVAFLRGTTPFHAKAGPLNTASLAAMIAMPLVVLHPLMAVHPIRRVPAETPEKLALAFQDVTLKTSDGLTLAGWFVPAKEPRGTVIYCHGYGQNRGQVISVLKPLHETSLNVLAFDFRGHGDSPGHTATFGHREVRDLQAACEAARKLGKDKPLFILGVSYGAAVALQALPQLSDVAGVWVDSTFGRFTSVLNRGFGFFPESYRGHLVSVCDALIWLDCGFWGSQIDLKQSLKDVRTPIYFCHGKHDPLTDFAESKALYESYAGPKWHYWINRPSDGELKQSAQRGYYRRMREFFKKRLEEL